MELRAAFGLCFRHCLEAGRGGGSARCLRPALLVAVCDGGCALVIESEQVLSNLRIGERRG